jgi:hypothetical protein
VAEASVSTLQAMNPLVKVGALVQAAEQLEASKGVAGYDIVLLLHPSLALQQRLDQQCR